MLHAKLLLSVAVLNLSGSAFVRSRSTLATLKALTHLVHLMRTVKEGRDEENISPSLKNKSALKVCILSSCFTIIVYIRGGFLVSMLRSPCRESHITIMVSIKDFSYLSAFYHIFIIFFSKDPGNVGPNICIGRYGAISTSSAIYSGLRPPFLSRNNNTYPAHNFSV